LDFGLHWIRRRRRDLTRAVLLLFLAAWVQAAVVPCVMASAPDGDQAHCPYCPPAGHAQGGHEHGAGSCDTSASCAYPHDPQVDARTVIASLLALPVAYLSPSFVPVVIARDAGREAPEVIPRVRLPVSYCRLIE
jgi:hypothetical protein